MVLIIFGWKEPSCIFIERHKPPKFCKLSECWMGKYLLLLVLNLLLFIFSGCLLSFYDSMSEAKRQLFCLPPWSMWTSKMLSFLPRFCSTSYFIRDLVGIDLPKHTQASPRRQNESVYVGLSQCQKREGLFRELRWLDHQRFLCVVSFVI